MYQTVTSDNSCRSHLGRTKPSWFDSLVRMGRVVKRLPLFSKYSSGFENDLAQSRRQAIPEKNRDENFKLQNVSPSFLFSMTRFLMNPLNGEYQLLAVKTFTFLNSDGAEFLTEKTFLLSMKIV